MRSMSKSHQLLCVWCSALGILVLGIGYWPIANFFPPHNPMASADEIVAIYQQHTFDIRLGMILMQVGAAMLFPFLAVVSLQMRRIEGAQAVLADTQMLAGLINYLFLLVPAFIWTVAAFRPDRSPEITLLMNDMGWLAFIMPITPAVIQNLAIGFAVLADKGERPVYPRWLAFFNFLASVLFIADLMITFFKTGPFAWNGLISFYVPLTVFTLWAIVMIALTLKAVNQQQ